MCFLVDLSMQIQIWNISFACSKLHLKTDHVEDHNIVNLTLCSAFSSIFSFISLSSLETTLCTVSDDVYSSASTLHRLLYRAVASVSYAHMTVLKWTQMQKMMKKKNDDDDDENVNNKRDELWKLLY